MSEYAPSHAAFFPRPPDVEVEWLLRGLEAAVERLDEATTPFADPAEVFAPLSEALNWAVSLDDRLGHQRERDPVLLAFRFVRNRVHHGWAYAIQFEPGAEIGIMIIGVSPIGVPSTWTWRSADELPESGNRNGESEYVDLLQARPVGETLRNLLQAFRRDLRPRHSR